MQIWNMKMKMGVIKVMYDASAESFDDTELPCTQPIDVRTGAYRRMAESTALLYGIDVCVGFDGAGALTLVKCRKYRAHVHLFAFWRPQSSPHSLLLLFPYRLCVCVCVF